MTHFYKKLSIRKEIHSELLELINNVHRDFLQLEKIEKNLIFYCLEEIKEKNYYNINHNHYNCASAYFSNIVRDIPSRKIFFEKLKLLSYFSNSFLHNFRYHRHTYCIDEIIYPYVLAVVNTQGTFEIAKSLNNNDRSYSPRLGIQNLSIGYEILNESIETKILVEDNAEPEGAIYLFHAWYWHTWKTENPECKATTFIPDITDSIEFENYINFIENL